MHSGSVFTTILRTASRSTARFYLSQRSLSVLQAQQVPTSPHLVLPAVAPGTIAATELRPWGSFTVLEEGRGYKIKRIEVKPGHRLSLQMHHHRSEHWIVVSGTARGEAIGQQPINLRAGLHAPSSRKSRCAIPRIDRSPKRRIPG
jgi:hypothetical protein